MARLGVLRRREFRLVLGGQAVSGLGDRMAAVALAFAVLEIGGSASEVGLVLAAGVVPLVGCVLVGGVVADRAPRRTVMVVSDLARVASQGAMAALLISGAAEVWMLALLAAVSGAATGFFSPASTGLLPEVVPADQLQPANALRSSAISVGEILGPAVAGVVIAAAGAGWALAVDAATFALSAACLALLRLPKRLILEAGSFVADLRDGWEAFRSRRWVWTFVAYFAAGNVLWASWLALGPIVARNNLGGAAAWGTVLAAAGIGTLVGSLLATHVEPGRPLLFVAVTDALFALPLACLAGTTSVVILAAGALLSSVGVTVAASVWESTLQRRIPRESLSRVSAYDWFGSLVFSAFGLAAWGPIAGAIGVSAALWLAFGLSVVVILGLLSVPEIRYVREAPQPVPPAATPPDGPRTSS
jgi:MFS family permease